MIKETSKWSSANYPKKVFFFNRSDKQIKKIKYKKIFRIFLEKKVETKMSEVTFDTSKHFMPYMSANINVKIVDFLLTKEVSFFLNFSFPFFCFFLIPHIFIISISLWTTFSLSILFCTYILFLFFIIAL